MGKYKPISITGMTTGLIQNRQDFLIANDAYPQLINAYIFRERIKRKQGKKILGQLRRKFTNQSLGNTGASPWNFNLWSTLVPPIVPESTAHIEPGSVSITIQSAPNEVYNDDGKGNLIYQTTMLASGTINYISGNISLTHTAGAGVPTIVSFNYFPGLPVMGIRTREISNITRKETVFFDTKYAYAYNGGFFELQPGTTWTGSDFNFFWSTNYWVDNANNKIFWATNDVDPIRYTNGLNTSNWIDFTPRLSNTDPTITLQQALCIVPFRGRLVVFRTTEKNVVNFQRIRWSAIGNPFSDVSAIVTSVNDKAWYDDIRGQGGFLDIPTSEDIISVGFVRDNLIVECETSTWQLRYTGRSIAPFQIEKVNSELGVQCTFSLVQFDTSVVGIGDRGIIECDSYQAQRIDINIPDFTQSQISLLNNGLSRVHGIRDFENRLAYWTYPSVLTTPNYPDLRLCYNYENKSYSIFTDSITALGYYQPSSGRRWTDYPTLPWKSANFPWFSGSAEFPYVMGGNQQGYIHFLNQQVTDDESLTIFAIVGNAATNQPTQVTSYNHNMQTNQFIEIVDIPTGTGYASLNGGIFRIVKIDNDNFTLYVYNPLTGLFDDQLDTSQTYIGGGKIQLRDNFSIVSKRFNYIEQDQNIQLGYVDILTNTTPQGAFTMNVYGTYTDYDVNDSVNNLPNNIDSFFNTEVTTYLTSDDVQQGSKAWQRVFCPTNSSFITVQYTFSNAQMSGAEFTNEVEIGAQTLWVRPGGRLQFLK